MMLVEILVVVALIVSAISLYCTFKCKFDDKQSSLGVPVKIMLVDGAKLPERNDPTDGGYDVYGNLELLKAKLQDTEYFDKFVHDAAIVTTGPNKGKLIIKPNGRILIPTGIYTSFSPDYKVNMRPRSGLASKFGLTLINTPGLIDANYRNDVGILLTNQGSKAIAINFDKPLCQIEIVRNIEIDWQEVEDIASLDGGNRGGGFGHSDEPVIDSEVIDEIDATVAEHKATLGITDNPEDTAKKVAEFANAMVDNTNDSHWTTIVFEGKLNWLQVFVIKLITYRKMQ